MINFVKRKAFSLIFYSTRLTANNLFSRFADTLYEIQENSRSSIKKEILINYLKDLNPAQISVAIHLLDIQNHFRNIKVDFTASKKAIILALQKLLNLKKSSMDDLQMKYGDPGLIAKKHLMENNLKLISDHSTNIQEMNLNQLYKYIYEFHRFSGTDSIESKKSLMIELFKKCTTLNEMYYLPKVVLVILNTG